MKFNIKMPHRLKPFYYRELSESKLALEENEFTTSWHHLERAHILAQPYPVEHTAVHWKMLVRNQNKRYQRSHWANSTFVSRWR